MRRMTFVLGVLLGIACDQSEMFDGEPCHVDKDCWHDQECTRTEQERLADLPGVCADEGTGCLPGEQLGCVCDPDDSSINCSYAAAPIGEEYPAMTCDPIQRVCVLAPPDDPTEG